MPSPGYPREKEKDQSACAEGEWRHDQVTRLLIEKTKDKVDPERRESLRNHTGYCYNRWKQRHHLLADDEPCSMCDRTRECFSTYDLVCYDPPSIIADRYPRFGDAVPAAKVCLEYTGAGPEVCDVVFRPAGPQGTERASPPWRPVPTIEADGWRWGGYEDHHETVHKPAERAARLERLRDPE